MKVKILCILGVGKKNRNSIVEGGRTGHLFSILQRLLMGQIVVNTNRQLEYRINNTYREIKHYFE